METETKEQFKFDPRITFFMSLLPDPANFEDCVSFLVAYVPGGIVQDEMEEYTEVYEYLQNLLDTTHIGWVDLILEVIRSENKALLFILGLMVPWEGFNKAGLLIL